MALVFYLCLPKILSLWRKHRINNIQAQRVARPTEHVTLLHKRPRGTLSCRDGVFGRHNVIVKKNPTEVFRLVEATLATNAVGSVH
jgi:hypothetical protein